MRLMMAEDWGLCVLGLAKGPIHVGDEGALSNSLRKTNIMMYQNMLSSIPVRVGQLRWDITMFATSLHSSV